jgi:hypothetical protein
MFHCSGVGSLRCTAERMMRNKEERPASELRLLVPPASARDHVGEISEPRLRRQRVEIVERDLSVAEWIPAGAVAESERVATALARR